MFRFNHCVSVAAGGSSLGHEMFTENVTSVLENKIGMFMNDHSCVAYFCLSEK